MTRALAPLLLLGFAASASAQTTGAGSVCPGLYGWQAERCVRQNHAPQTVLGYDEARDLLFAVVWSTPRIVQDASGHLDTLGVVEGLYGGAETVYHPGSAGSPREQAQGDDFGTEHIWPQSRGADRGAARSDLHHLAPAYGPFRSARGNRAFTDNRRYIYKWHKGRSTRYVRSAGNPLHPDLSSGTESSFQRAHDDGDGFESVMEQGRFVPRHVARGPAARAAAYFLALYRVQALAAPEGQAFIDAVLAEIYAWADWGSLPEWAPTQAERYRNDRIERIQGNRNPFVDDPTLFRRVFVQRDQAPPRPHAVWINEIHAENDGPDTGEGVEIAGPGGLDLYGFSLWFYSGGGHPYSAGVSSLGEAERFVFLTDTLSGVGGLSTVWVPAERLRGGCNGLALIGDDGIPIQFVSYGGCRFNALSGPVFEHAEALGKASPSHSDSLAWSHPVTGLGRFHPQQWSTLPPGQSLQLMGAGNTFGDFTWTLAAASPGTPNRYQSAGSRDAQLARADALTTAQVDLSGLTLYPNPARAFVRLDVPPGVRLRVAVYDALGRRFHAPQPLPGMLDVSGLAPGLYLARITGEYSGRVPQTVTRRFTVGR
jgi:endonuclease I